ncbi:hypothetical protein THAOC_33946, partial [Thalassiosira oceanica]
LHAFKDVLKGGDLDVAKLLEAIRAHLALMRSGGAALKLVARDLESNLNKAENLFRTLPDRDRRSLEVLLHSEKQEGVHFGNELDNKSGAMGLLWIRRSLEFQRNFYLALIPPNGRHPKDSAVTAYERVLSPYHGWLLRSIFPASLSQMPSRDVFIARFAGIELEDLSQEIESQVIRKLRSLVLTWEPLLVKWKDIFERLDLEDVRQAKCASFTRRKGMILRTPGGSPSIAYLEGLISPDSQSTSSLLARGAHECPSDRTRTITTLMARTGAVPRWTRRGRGLVPLPLALGGLTGGDDDVPSSSRTTELDVPAARVREARGRTCPGPCVAAPARGRGAKSARTDEDAAPWRGGASRTRQAVLRGGMRHAPQRRSRRGRMDGSESGGRWVRRHPRRDQLINSLRNALIRLHLLGSNDYKLARRQATEANIRLDLVPKDEVNEVFQVRYRIHSDMAKLIPLMARNDRAKSEISALRTKWRSAVQYLRYPSTKAGEDFGGLEALDV